MPLPQDVRFDPLHLMRMLGLDPDSWQAQVLQGPAGNLLLNCCRQAGKSTVVALHALLEALTQPRHLVLLLSASHRQSRELFGLVRGFWERLKAPFRGRVSATELCFKHGSRVVSLPCREDTIRGYSGVNLLIIDEAARVPDDLYRAVRPMLAVSGGRLICMSTPFGKRGFFYEAWTKGGDSWQRIEVPARAIPRIAASFLDEERRELGETAFRQEYCCSFEVVEGLVYPEFAKLVVAKAPAGLAGRRLAAWTSAIAIPAPPSGARSIVRTCCG